MKTLVLTASLLTAATLPSAWTGPSAGRHLDDSSGIDQQTALDGTWRARLQDNWTRKDGEQWVSLQLEQDGDRNFGFSIPMAELEGMGVRSDRWTAKRYPQIRCAAPSEVLKWTRARRRHRRPSRSRLLSAPPGVRSSGCHRLVRHGTVDGMTAAAFLFRPPESRRDRAPAP